MKIHLCGILVGSILLVGCDESGRLAELARDDTTSDEREAAAFVAEAPGDPASGETSGERAPSPAEADGAQLRGAADDPGGPEDDPTAAADPRDGALDEVTAPPETAEGFGCPVDSKCHEHCKSVGFDGGYCEGLFDLRCQCYWL